MELFQRFLNQAKQTYRQADKQVGGWLPGGGVPSPVTPIVKQKAAYIRDNALIPVIDKGLSAGVIPPSQGMFVRFLTGTSKPLTELAPSLQSEIPKAYANAKVHADAATLKTQKNPEWDEAFNSAFQETSKLFQDPVIAKMAAMQKVNSLNIPRTLFEKIPTTKQENIPVKYTDYPENASLNNTLGQFNVNPKRKEVTDRYDFNYYMPNSPELEVFTNPVQGAQMLLLEQNPRGVIPFAHALGLIRPGAGYDITAPLK